MSQDFWSRRRQAVAAEAVAEEEAVEKAQLEQMQADLDAVPDAEILAELDLPDPDTLESSDAVKNFLSHDLPQRLKTRALRRLWRLNPVLANVDGLVDYGEDYTDAATVIEGLQTAYQVGKGMLAHVEAMAEKAAQEAEEESAPPEEDVPPLEEEALILAEVETAPPPSFDPPEPPLPETLDAPQTVPNPSRRMTFQFESVT